ncbi:MAG: DUF2236 domain-containing protein [Acidobacteria bacterium]|nr:DUF2236 domain-containing protein [Acidobacteriota bacterium]
MIELSTENLERLRGQTDEVGDRVVAAIFEHHDLDSVNEVFRSLLTNSASPDALPPEAKEYFRGGEGLPADADRERIARAQEVFTKYGPTLFMTLFCKSLPECYSCWRGAEVLFRTGRMIDDAPDFRNYSRRLMETAQFVLDVLVEGGLETDGRGLASIRKVRLIHASIRRYLLAQGWDRATYGLPINQEDEAGTLMSFSITVLQGLEALGVRLEIDEKEAFVYTWALVGRLLGISADILPATVAEAGTLQDAILRHQVGPSEAGRVLTRSAIDYRAYLSPGTLFDTYPEALMRYLVSPSTAAAIGITGDPEHEELDRSLLDVYRFFNREIGDAEDHSSLVRGASGLFERHLLEGIFRHFAHVKKIHFYIPPSLRGAWRLET